MGRPELCQGDDISTCPLITELENCQAQRSQLNHVYGGCACLRGFRAHGSLSVGAQEALLSTRGQKPAPETFSMHVYKVCISIYIYMYVHTGSVLRTVKRRNNPVKCELLSIVLATAGDMDPSYLSIYVTEDYTTTTENVQACDLKSRYRLGLDSRPPSLAAPKYFEINSECQHMRTRTRTYGASKTDLTQR